MSQQPTNKQMDDAAVASVRDVMVDAASKFSPTVRTLLLQQVNGAMAHISARLDLLQSLEAKEPPNGP